jgi:Holliday junction DNA helicase RuvA
MIATVYGKLEAKYSDHVIVTVGDAVGLRIYVSAHTLDQLGEMGQAVYLQTHLEVREDSLTLYGFLTEEGRDLFIALTSVSGVGPRLALATLSTLSPEMIINAVRREEPAVLARVPGIGKKTAERMVFELKGRLVMEALEEGALAISDVDMEVLGALTALGYSIVEAQAAIQSIPRDTPQDIEERIRIALAYFAR